MDSDAIMSTLILHDYWRSTASYRVRIAINFKNLDYAQVSHDLRKDAQRDTAYLELAPQGLVPSLESSVGIMTQSLAIIDWLDAIQPFPALLPIRPEDRASVLSMALLIGCDIHPINNLRVLTMLRRQFGANDEQIGKWIAHWVIEGFGALERAVEQHGQGYAWGSAVTVADCFLVPQVYAARRFGVDLSQFPAICAVDAKASRLPAFQRAHPSAQTDADI